MKTEKMTDRRKRGAISPKIQSGNSENGRGRKSSQGTRGGVALIREICYGPYDMIQTDWRYKNGVAAMRLGDITEAPSTKRCGRKWRRGVANSCPRHEAL